MKKSRIFKTKISPGPGALNATTSRRHDCQNPEKAENRTTALREKFCINEMEVSFLYRFSLESSLSQSGDVNIGSSQTGSDVIIGLWQ